MTTQQALLKILFDLGLVPSTDRMVWRTMASAKQIRDGFPSWRVPGQEPEDPDLVSSRLPMGVCVKLHKQERLHVRKSVYGTATLVDSEGLVYPGQSAASRARALKTTP